MYVFDNFTLNFATTEKQLKDVSKDNFIVVTKKEGARGIDYKGINVSHVIIGFEPESYS